MAAQLGVPSLSDQIAELIAIRDSSVQHLKDERKANDAERALQERDHATVTVETADVAALRARLAAQEAQQTAGCCMLQLGVPQRQRSSGAAAPPSSLCQKDYRVFNQASIVIQSSAGMY